MDEANAAIAEAKEYKDLDSADLKNMVDKFDLNKAKALTEEMEQSIADMKEEENKLADLIPDVHKWHSQFTIDELNAVYLDVERKLQDISGLSLWGQQDKLNRIMDRLDRNDPMRAVTRAALKQERSRVNALANYQSMVSLLRPQIAEAVQWSQDHPEYKDLQNYIRDFEDAVANMVDSASLDKIVEQVRTAYSDALAKETAKTAKAAKETAKTAKAAKETAKTKTEQETEPTQKPAGKPAKKLSEKEWRDEINGHWFFCGDSDDLKKSPAKNMNFKALREGLDTVCRLHGLKLSDFIVSSIDDESFDFTISAPSGDLNMMRTFRPADDGSLEVHHDILDLGKQYQGRGLSREIFGVLYEQYKQMNVRYMTVQADLDVGGYTWAQYGFNANTKPEAINAVKTHPGALSRQAVQFIEDYYKTNKLEVYEPFPMHLLVEHFGRDDAKKILLHSNWNGTIDLRDAKQKKVFEEYIYKKKKK